MGLPWYSYQGNFFLGRLQNHANFFYISPLKSLSGYSHLSAQFPRLLPELHGYQM